jgi:hypothetical protein
MKLLVYDESISSLFSTGCITFLIIRNDTNTTYVSDTTKEKYEEVLYKLPYNPLIFMTPLPQRLTYLYGCCNQKFNIPRETSFTFWYKYKNDKEYKKWFTIEPDRCSIYGISTFGGGYNLVQ